jgi:hypothetical protein
LRYSAAGKSGDFNEIGSATSIPMGSSSGKVPSILDYCRGMGLIKLSVATKKSALKTPELTDFGRIVLLEDPFLKCEITQWIAHFNLCNPTSGADVWYYTFFSGFGGIGDKCSRSDLENFLRMQFGLIENNLIGPMVGMYEDEAAFGKCGALSEKDEIITKRTAPVFDELARGYGAWIIQLAKNSLSNQQQISITELDKVAGWKTIPGWSNSTAIEVLELIEKKGLIRVDRHMTPWLIQAKMGIEQSWKGIYLDMI